VFSGVAWPDMNGRGRYKLVFEHERVFRSSMAWPVEGWECYKDGFRAK
jgi:hypothetical protein